MILPVLVSLAIGVDLQPTSMDGQVPGDVIVARTGPAVPSPGFQPVRLSSDPVRVHGGTSHYPETLSDSARYGLATTDAQFFPFVIDVIDGKYIAIVDVNGNRDLTDDPVVPLEMERPTGLHTATFQTGKSPIKLSLQVQSDGTVRVFHHAHNERKGTLDIPGRPLAFVVQGYQGRYDDEYDAVVFDLDGDGVVNTSRPAFLDERFQIRERYVNIDGRTYEFTVTRDGSLLTLSPSRIQRPSRTQIDPGNPVPHFSFEDLNGVAHHLADYQGKVVLLYSWGTWCAPCMEELPDIVALDDRHRAEGLAIVGVTRKDTRESVTAYVRARGISWTQTLGEQGPILDLFRIDRTPTSILIDRSGVIAARDLKGPDLRSRIEELLNEPLRQDAGE